MRSRGRWGDPSNHKAGLTPVREEREGRKIGQEESETQFSSKNVWLYQLGVPRLKVTPGSPLSHKNRPILAPQHAQFWLRRSMDLAQMWRCIQRGGLRSCWSTLPPTARSPEGDLHIAFPWLTPSLSSCGRHLPLYSERKSNLFQDNGRL